MPSRLICLTGAHKGEEFVLGPAGLSIGRSGTNDLVVDEVGVSRRHCAITVDAEGFVIADNDSHNHTWVNGAQVTRWRLRPGDQILVGLSTFSYVEETAHTSAPVTPSLDGDGSSADTIVLHRNDAVYLQPHAVLESDKASDESLNAIKLLLEVIEAMSSGGTLDALARRLVDLVRAILPVTSAGLVLVDGDDYTVHSSFSDESSAGAPPLPKGILRRVVHERLSICTNDIFAEGSFDPTESMITSQIRAVIAVPVVAEEIVIGVLHGTAGNVRLDGGHLQLLTGVAGAAAGSLASALRVQALEKQNRVLRSRSKNKRI